MKVAIVGTRDFTDNQKIFDTFVKVTEDLHITEIVSGGARGVDTAAVYVASCLGVPVREFKANWRRFGKSAGILRNTEIVDYSDKVVAFLSRSSMGTFDTIRKATKAGKLHKILYVDAL
jgi:hypothetical protein